MIRYLYPTDQQLRALAGVPKEKPKRGKHSENGKVGDVFHIPRNLDIQLESAKVTALDVVHLKYYTEYQWLLDFSLYASIVYILTEVSVLVNHCSSNIWIQCMCVSVYEYIFLYIISLLINVIFIARIVYIL